MNLKAGQFIKHKKHRDIGYQVRYAEIRPEGILVKFRYWNLKGASHPFPLGLSQQEFTLKNEDFENWEIVTA